MENPKAKLINGEKPKLTPFGLTNPVAVKQVLEQYENKKLQFEQSLNAQIKSEQTGIERKEIITKQNTPAPNTSKLGKAAPQAGGNKQKPVKKPVLKTGTKIIQNSIIKKPLLKLAM